MPASPLSPPLQVRACLSTHWRPTGGADGVRSTTGRVVGDRAIQPRYRPTRPPCLAPARAKRVLRPGRGPLRIERHALASGQAERCRGRGRVDRDGDRGRRAGDRPVRVLEPVPGDRADDGLAAGSSRRPRPTAAGRPRWRADAGSTKTPSARASSRYAARISPVGDRRRSGRRTRPGPRPPSSRTPGCRSGSRWRSSTARRPAAPVTIGAAPAAWKPNICGRRDGGPSAAYSR